MYNPVPLKVLREQYEKPPDQDELRTAHEHDDDEDDFDGYDTGDEFIRESAASPASPASPGQPGQPDQAGSDSPAGTQRDRGLTKDAPDIPTTPSTDSPHGKGPQVVKSTATDLENGKSNITSYSFLMAFSLLLHSCLLLTFGLYRCIQCEHFNLVSRM